MARLSPAMAFSLLLSLGPALTQENPQQYRLRVIVGAPLDNPEVIKAQETVVDQTVELQKDIEIGTQKSPAQVNAVLTRTEEGALHFKGRVRVRSTSGDLDTDVFPGKAFSPKGYLFGSIVWIFFVTIEELPPPKGHPDKPDEEPGQP